MRHLTPQKPVKLEKAMKTLVRTALIVVAAVVTVSLVSCASSTSEPATIGFYHGQAQPPIPAQNAGSAWVESHPAGQL